MTLLYLSAAFMAGVALGRLAWDAGVIGCEYRAWLWAALALCLPFTALLNRFRRESDHGEMLRWPRAAGFRAPATALSPAIVIACVVCAAAGVSRYAAQPLDACLDASDLAYWNAPENSKQYEHPAAVVRGYITSYPSVRDTTQRVDVRAQQMTIDGLAHSVDGIVRTEVGLDKRLTYGRPVEVQGMIIEPYAGDGGGYLRHLASRGIRSQMRYAMVTELVGPSQGNALRRQLYALRSHAESAVNRMLPEPYAALANGMLLGIETGIPRELMDKFQATGTSHVIVISGSNVALIAGVLAGLFARLLGRRRAWLPVVAGIAAYALLVGGDMAVLRAALMGGLAVTAVGLGRQGSGIVALGAACWALLLANPLTLWDVGFQLSAMATLGLIVLTPKFAGIAAHLWPGWMGGPLSSPYLASDVDAEGRRQSQNLLRGLLEDGVIVTLAATIAVTPLIAYTFGRISVVGIVANLLITPVQPIITMWGSAGALVGAIGVMPLASALMWLTWPSLYWTVRVVDAAAVLPMASVTVGNYGFGAMVVTYILMATALWWKPMMSWLGMQRTDDTQSIGRAIARPTAILAVALLALLVWWAVLSLPDGRLHVHFLDIGQGDGILIVTPSGRQVLVDGGSSPQMLLSELGEVMPFWDRTLDVVVLTHADGDHMDAQAQAISRFEVDVGVTTQVALDSTDSVGWRAALERAGIPVTVQHAGGWIDLGDGAALWVLNPDAQGIIGPDPDNENSLVLKLVYGEFSVLLTGDAGLVSEHDWIAGGLPIQSTVLKAGHHGSRTSTSERFVQAADPQLVVIQVGAENNYGHPHAEVLDNLAGREVLRNDVDGRVHVTSDGVRMWIDTEKGASR